MTYSLKDLITAFLEHWQYVKKRSPETTRNYELYLRRFQRWSNLTSAKNITPVLIQRYRVALRTMSFEGKKLNPSTINYHLIALRNFLKYLQVHNIAVPIEKKIKLHTYKPDHRITPTKSELVALIRAPKKSLQDPEIIRLRDQAVLGLMIDTGWKVATISRLQKIHVRGRTINRDNGYSVPLGKNTEQLLRSYTQKRHDSNVFLFIPHDRAASNRTRAKKTSKPMTPRSIQRLVKKYVILAHISRPLTADSLTKVKSLS